MGHLLHHLDGPFDRDHPRIQRLAFAANWSLLTSASERASHEFVRSAH